MVVHTKQTGVCVGVGAVLQKPLGNIAFRVVRRVIAVCLLIFVLLHPRAVALVTQIIGGLDTEIAVVVIRKSHLGEIILVYKAAVFRHTEH